MISNTNFPCRQKVTLQGGNQHILSRHFPHVDQGKDVILKQFHHIRTYNKIENFLQLLSLNIKDMKISPAYAFTCCTKAYCGQINACKVADLWVAQYQTL